MISPLLQGGRVVAGVLLMLALAASAIANHDAASAPHSQPPSTPDARWSMRLPKEELVSYRGVVSFDEAGAGTGAMMYPAPNALGFVVAVITHGAIVESVKSAEKRKLQEAADKVLQPYQEVLGGFKHQELMQRALAGMAAPGAKRLVAHAEEAADDWLLESAPVFSLTQDQSAIVLDNTVSIYAPGNSAVPVYQNTVTVISQPRAEADLAQFWTADRGERLKEESARLVAQSLDIVMSEASRGAAPEGAHKTVRFNEGRTEKMERGQILSAQCDRVVLKTLRGWLMSVPAPRSASAPADERCADPAAATRPPTSGKPTELYERVQSIN